MPGHQTWQCVISSCGGFVKDNVYDPPLPKTLPELLERINTAIGKSHKTCLGGFGGNGSIAWTSAVSHVGRTSNAFKVTIKLQTFLFQMVVTSCISVTYLWKYGFAKSSDNLYAPCIVHPLVKIKKALITINEINTSCKLSINYLLSRHWSPLVTGLLAHRQHHLLSY